MLADRQTNRHDHHNTPLLYRRRSNKAIVDSRLRFRCSPLLSRFENIRRFRVAFSYLVDNVQMTSSTKPEVYKLLHCRQRRTEPRPPTGNMHNNFVQFGYVVFETRDRTGRHTDRQTRRLQYFTGLRECTGNKADSALCPHSFRN